MAKPKNPKKTNGEVSATPVQSAAATLPPVENSSAVETSAASTAKAPRKATGKPSIVKSDSRATLVPINLDEEIRRLAYLMSERRGFEPGHEAEDWLAAEREVRQRYHQQSA